MIRKLLLLSAIITVFATTASVAQVGCRSWKFVGSYVRVDPPNDVYGDGTVIHQFIFNMTLNTDGTASQSWSGALDYPMNSGTVSQSIGSWTCRADGKLIVTFLSSTYLATTARVSTPDIKLESSSRTTYLISVTDENTLTRISARVRTYAAADNPTNPNGGTLGALSTREIIYKRFIASDADLLLP
jgi:hypothetical protein